MCQGRLLKSMTHCLTSSPTTALANEMVFSLIYSSTCEVYKLKFISVAFSSVIRNFETFAISGKSAVWNFFKITEEARDSAVCQVCSQAIKNRVSNTSNLLRHLQKKTSSSVRYYQSEKAQH